jgi:hypothetical protein
MPNDPANTARWVTIVLFLGVLVMLEVGRRVGLRRMADDGTNVHEGIDRLETAVFALLGLLIAFTFSGAAARFDSRRQLVVEEANAIGTAYLRLDLLPAVVQPAMRDDFRRYVDSRLAVYRALPDIAAARAELDRSSALQKDIWGKAVAACRMADAAPSASMLLLPALNQMIDITTTRTVAAQIHPPAIIFGMLVVLTLASALLAGFDLARGRRRSWLHALAFAGMITVTVYVIFDLEYPRLGFIRIDAIDQVLIELRASMQ